MKLLQFRTDSGKLRAGLIEGGRIQHLSSTVTRLLSLIGRAGIPAAALREMVMPEDRPTTYEELDQPGRLALPIQPPEVWAAGLTYRPVGVAPQADSFPERPELFFKATFNRCVGPHEPIGLREDSAITLPEAELAVVIGDEGRIIGYTLGNDVTATSIRREGPMYQTQSKIYSGCCALGPVLVTADEIPDPRQLELHCRVLRGSRCLFEGWAQLSRMRRPVEDLVDWLLRCNEVPGGTVLLTGCGILLPPECALAEGDVVEVRCDAIGTLRNPCCLISARRSRDATV